MTFVALWRAAVPAAVRDRIALARSRLTPFAGNSSYSGEGEDAVILSWLRYHESDISKIRYIDVGAAHPVRLSNTYNLYRLGARGVLVEPDPTQARTLRRARPNDIVVEAGVAFDDRRSAPLYRLTSRVFNTFSREKAERVVADSQKLAPHMRQSIIDTVDVPLIPINDIIRRHLAAPPDVVSIDTEGADFAILNSLDLSLLPSDREAPCLICLEKGDYDYARLCQVLEPAGFEMAARTPSNWIFLRGKERIR
jgi:FkbM family methyltransferase